MKKLILSAIVILGFSAVSFGQTNSATANASANIIRPITIQNNTALAFGNISSGPAGTVVLPPTAAATRTATGGIVLPPLQTGSVTAADFTVSGEGATLYTLTLPTSTTIQSGTSGPTMTLDTFTSSLAGASGTLSGTAGGAGTQDVKVGATLNLGVAQATGSYTGTFSVTVNYN